MKRNWVLEILFGWITAYMGRVGFILYSGGGDAPSPDPQIGAAALKNAQLGQEAFDFYKQEYINQKPAQEKLSALALQVQQQLVESGKLNNEYAKDYHDYMTETFRPLEKDIVDHANEYDTAGRREAEAEKGLADVTQSFDQQRQITQRNNERMGINPNSGNAQALDAQLSTAEAIAGASAKNKGRKDAEALGTALKMDAASLGRNLPSNQATSQQIANSSSTGAVNVGLADAQNVRAQSNVQGQGYQTAMQGYTNQANILQNQYSGELSAYNAQQQSDAGAWAGIGTLAGAALMFASDEDIKKDIENFDEDDALEGLENTKIKKWAYDPDKVQDAELVEDEGKEHIGAMAQDLQKNFGDDVSDGKTVDVISAIGLNMAATKALSKKVDALMKEEASEPLEKKNGGVVKGKGTETSDSIPAKLSKNEFIMNAGTRNLSKKQIIQAVKNSPTEFGLDALYAINNEGLKARKGAK